MVLCTVFTKQKKWQRKKFFYFFEKIFYFFANYDTEATRRVMRDEEGKIVAQMQCFVFDDVECGEKGCYIYGVTTLPECRGAGLAQKMIEGTLEELRHDGVGYVVLIAQEDGLRAWYERLGFRAMGHTIDVRGLYDDMNFAMDDIAMNQGLYYLLRDGIENFSKQINLFAGI